MTDTGSPRIAELRRHEEDLLFPVFDHHDAWRLGSLRGPAELATGAERLRTASSADC